jgi:tRNA (mo5U34)-methyltransferase
VTASEERQAQADALLWFHSIDLGDGVVTKGLGEQWMGPDVFPDFTGRSVLDIGAWDGYYSFLAEQNGASRVVSLDHYSWGVDFGLRNAYWAECAQTGAMPDHSRDVTDFWNPDLPGRRGYEFARDALHSKAEAVVGDYAAMDLAPLGMFDVVLYLGVLYHMEEPLTCLKKVRSLTTEVAVIETEAIHIEGLEDACLLQFNPGDALRSDYGNWYVPTIGAIHAMCTAAGFSSVRTVVGPPPAPAREPEPRRARLARQAGGLAPLGPPSAPSANYRALVHAFV